MAAAFETGKTYYARSAGDSECVWTFEVLRRTDKSVWIKDRSGAEVRRAVRVSFEEVECFDPFGRYSMSPVVFADRLANPPAALQQ